MLGDVKLMGEATVKGIDFVERVHKLGMVVIGR
jgi:hypothetical protein